MNKAKSNILKYITKNPNANNREIAKNLGLSVRIVIYHLNWLQAEKFKLKNLLRKMIDGSS